MNKEKYNIKNIKHNSKHKTKYWKDNMAHNFQNNHFQIKEVVRNCLLKHNVFEISVSIQFVDIKPPRDELDVVQIKYWSS